jgi:hypothetical protein
LSTLYIANNNNTLFNFPSSVSLANLQAGNPAFLKWKLKNVDFAIGVAFGDLIFLLFLSSSSSLGMCANQKLPWLSVTCVGNDCGAFAQPCNSDSECGDLKCAPLLTNSSQNVIPSVNSLFDVFKSAKVYDDLDISPGCLPVQDILVEGLNNVKRQVFGAPETYTNTPTSVEIRVCQPSTFVEVSDFGSLIETTAVPNLAVTVLIPFTSSFRFFYLPFPPYSFVVQESSSITVNANWFECNNQQPASCAGLLEWDGVSNGKSLYLSARDDVAKPR